MSRYDEIEQPRQLRQGGLPLILIDYPCTRCKGQLGRTRNVINEATGRPEPSKYVCQDCGTAHILVDVGTAGESSMSLGAGGI